jgi:hypothetical protein
LADDPGRDGDPQTEGTIRLSYDIARGSERRRLRPA